MTPEQIEDQLLELAEKNYEELEQALGSATMRQAEKQLMLQVVDTLWVRHLTGLDALREGIGLRAVGQQDPLVAFKKDAFEMYNQLKEEIKEEVVHKIYHTTVVREAPQPRNVQAIHPNAAAAGQAETPGATKSAPVPVRVQKTLGRNDLCYCGSGKKYKHCHMKSDMLSGNGNVTEKAAAGNQSNNNKKKRAGK
jgi:preprotein translocase subunit SecA